MFSYIKHPFLSPFDSCWATNAIFSKLFRLELRGTSVKSTSRAVPQKGVPIKLQVAWTFEELAGRFDWFREHIFDNFLIFN